MSEYRLNLDGPHSDDSTGHVAGALSESVRVLNHATREAGITTPNTVDDVLGHLSAATSGLDQLLRQLGQRLNSMHTAGQVGHDNRPPEVAVLQARLMLTEGRSLARALAERIDRARRLTAGMYLRDDQDGGDHG
jgi:biotin carboxylase